MFVLKPLRAALADRDRVYAVVAGDAVNSDGRTAGLPMPSPAAQAELLERAYAAAGIEPGDVDYVEAHGTGTQAGDPVECAALGAVLGKRRDGAPLPVGSVKSNVGHLEAAAGVAGVCKALLVLRERVIPRTLHSEPVSQAIDFAGLGLVPVTRSRELPKHGRCVVGVNSFGFGGANAHVVLASPDPAPDGGHTAPDALLPVVVSARTQRAAAEAAVRLAGYLTRAGAPGLRDVAFTACRRRARHSQRIAVLAATAAEAAQRLRLVAAGDPATAAASAAGVQNGTVGFVFSGNGALWHGAGASLLAAEAAFAAEVEAVDAALAPLLGWSVRDELASPGDPARWELTEVAQPLLFAIQAGLVAALAERGITPKAVVGHSVGEVAAAYCAGILDRESACLVIAERSRAQAATLGAGRMAAVGLGAEETGWRLHQAGLDGLLVVAGINTDQDVTVAGDGDALTTWGTGLQDEGVFFRDLGLSYAFHSPAMDGLREPLAEALAGLEPAAPRVRFFSAVTGSAAGEPLDAGYWWRNIREPVRFAEAATGMTGPGGCDVLAEIGPHPVLSTYLRRVVASWAHPVAVAPTMTRVSAGPSALQGTLAQLLATGAQIDWDKHFPGGGRVVTLPAYPWERERHWSGDPGWWLEGGGAEPEAEQHPLLGARQSGIEPAWQQAVEPGRLPWLADHKVGEAVVMPAAAFADMALSAAAVWDGPVEVTGLAISKPLVLPFDDPSMDVRTHTRLSAGDGSLVISSRAGGESAWGVHVRGRARRLLRDQPPPLDLGAIGARLPQPVAAADHYARCARIGLPYGPAFQTVETMRAGDGEALATFRTTVAAEPGHHVHPTVLDGALQSGLALAAGPNADDRPLLPEHIATIRCWRRVPGTGAVHVRLVTADDAQTCVDIVMTGPDGEIALELLGLRVRPFAGGTSKRPVSRLVEVLRAAPLSGTPAPPSPLPAPGAVLAACAGELAALTERWHACGYAGFQPRLLELTAHFTSAAVHELLPNRDVFTAADLIAAGVMDTNRSLLGQLLDIAETHGLVAGVATSGGQQSWRHAGKPDPAGKFRELLADFPGECVFLRATGACGRHLTGVLTGRQDPLELLFSDADALAARIYDSTPILTYHNQAARLLLRTAMAGWPAGRLAGRCGCSRSAQGPAGLPPSCCRNSRRARRTTAIRTSPQPSFPRPGNASAGSISSATRPWTSTPT
jgi:acyl transferase domain-containing protein